MKSEDTMSFHAPDPEDDDNISLCSCLLRLPQMAEIIKAFSDDETLKSLACRYVWWLMRQKPPAAMSNLWVAELAKKRWNKKLVPEKVKLIQDKYRRPASCPTVCSLTVNDPEIWAQLQHYQRRVDLTVANIQQTVRKAALLSLKTANALVNTKEPDQTTTDKISWLHNFTGPCQSRALRALQGENKSVPKARLKALALKLDCERFIRRCSKQILIREVAHLPKWLGN